MKRLVAIIMVLMFACFTAGPVLANSNIIDAVSNTKIVESSGNTMHSDFQALGNIDTASNDIVAMSEQDMAQVRGGNLKLIYTLMKYNVYVYGYLGWQIGRQISISQYGVDPGPWPGLWNALTGRY